jgi:hypothetical protein
VAPGRLGEVLLDRARLHVELRPAGTSYTLRGFVRFEWRRGKKKVVKRTHRYTSAGHPGTRDADPEGYSARKCKISGPPQQPPPPPYEDSRP